jgi:hypothetical protein
MHALETWQVDSGLGWMSLVRSEHFRKRQYRKTLHVMNSLPTMLVHTRGKRDPLSSRRRALALRFSSYFHRYGVVIQNIARL